MTAANAENSLQPVTTAMDAFFLDRYCCVVGPWFNLLDDDHHFTHVLPHLSLLHPLLHLSVLASAAKQHYLTSSQRADTALAYYNAALRMLTATLNTILWGSSAILFTSCLLLTHCEMINASNQDWHLHLYETSTHHSTHECHDCSGGLTQACFWIYCRMDVLSSLATAEPTRLDTAIWLPAEHALALRDDLNRLMST